MATQTIILIGVGVYMVIMIAVGFYASRGAQSLTDFVVAGRKMPLWLCSTSVFATWFGSGTMMGAATATYEGDTLLMIGEPFSSGLALLLSGLFFARLYRRSRRLTWPEFFEARFGKLAGTVGSIADVTASIIWLGGVLFTFGVLLESLAGAPMPFLYSHAALGYLARGGRSVLKILRGVVCFSARLVNFTYTLSHGNVAVIFRH